MSKPPKAIKGVKYIKKNGYALCYIEDLSNELQKIIRQRLSAICFGMSNAASGKKLYSYQSTIKEFLIRYNSKPPNTKKGLIGELLTHILIAELFPEYNVVSPFFNLEERSIKKGFDVVLTSIKNNQLWITEVKSGELHKHRTSDETMDNLVSLACRDLLSRLNRENKSLWLNAINDAKIALDKHNDLKEVVVDILENLGDKSNDGLVDSKELNVFLTGMLFAQLTDMFCEARVKQKQKAISSENKFNSIFVLSIQKNTYRKVYAFLKQEGENEEKRLNTSKD